MAYVAQNDVEMLWNEMGNEKSWGALKSALQKHQNIGEAYDENLSSNLNMVADRMKGYDFPNSPDELANVLNQRLGTWVDESHPHH